MSDLEAARPRAALCATRASRLQFPVRVGPVSPKPRPLGKPSTVALTLGAMVDRSVKAALLLVPHTDTLLSNGPCLWLGKLLMLQATGNGIATFVLIVNFRSYRLYA
jgi:hypothetical protein